MARRSVLAWVSLCLLVVVGCGGGSSSTVPPPPPDFSITIQPASLSLVLGTSSQVQINESSLNGFKGTVSLNASSLPAGVTISPALPQNVGPSGLSLSLAVAANANAGMFSVPLTATSGSLQHSASLQLTLGKRANVSLSVPNQKVNVARGASALANIWINSDGGIVDFNVQLQASVPGGIVATFSSASVSPNTQVGLTLATSMSALTGPGTVTVLATRSVDGVQVSASFPIYVDPPSGTIPGNRSNWVRMGSNPIAVYYDAPRNHVLASLPAMNRVQVMDPGTGNLVSSIPVSIANFAPNGVWLASSSNLSGSLDRKSLLALGSGHVATIDLASGLITAQQALPMAIPIGWTTPNPISPTFLVAASGGHMVFGSWGDSSFYNWDGVSPLASLHSISDLYSFDRSFDGTKVLVASGDTSGAYQLLDIASDTIAAKGNYSNATIMTVRGNPARSEWAVANSNGIDFLDANLNRIATVPASFVGSLTYWGMTYSVDGKYLYFGYAPTGLPFLVTVDDSTHQVIRIAPATGTTIAYYRRVPPEWIVQPFAADSSGLVFGLGEKGLVIDDSTYTVDPTQATPADYAIIATPDNGPLSGSTVVQITTQSYPAQPDVWFGTGRAVAESLNPSGQVSATTPSAPSLGPVNIKLFPPDGYTHVIPQAFTYGTMITSVRDSVCPASGGCTADIFGFGLFGSNSSQTALTIAGNAAPLQSTHYFNTDEPYPYPLQYVRVTVPPGLAGPADVSVKTGIGQATLRDGFLYASSLQSYPSAQGYNALLFDERRGILYASTNSGISRFSLSSSSFLAPITPPSITGQNLFETMSLTPDGSRLIVANKQDVSVAIIDPDNPTSAKAIAVPATGANAAGPVFVAATSTGKVLISVGGFIEPWVGPMFELDLATLQVQPLTFPGVFTGDGPRLSATADGSAILIRGSGGPVGMWRASTQQFFPLADNFAGSGLGSAAGDGNLFAVGLGFIAPDGTSTVGLGMPDELGGFQGVFPNDAALNDSGSLEFAPSGKSLFILDTHHGDVLRSVALPNQVNAWTKVIALDSSAEHVFLSDSQGLTVLSLAAAPLAIGSISPSIVATGGGTIVTVRGSGFQTGSVVTIGGAPATSVFVDANTLQVTVPANPTGAAQMIVKNPNGDSYQLDASVLYQ
jgi:hypothetical protein